jgi:hypothetical protein
MKNKITDQGFAIVDIILALVIVVLIVGVGWLAYSRYHKAATANISVTSGVKPIISAAPVTPSAPSANPNIIKLPDLGIQVTFPNSLADLTYAIGQENSFGTGTTGTAAYLSTDALAQADPDCVASSSPNSSNGGHVGNPLGTLAKINGTYPSKTTTASSGQLELQEKGYYIAFQGSTYDCSQTKSVQTMQTNDKLSLDGVLGGSKPSAVQLIQ